jgi:hypothetical protein
VSDTSTPDSAAARAAPSAALPAWVCAVLALVLGVAAARTFAPFPTPHYEAADLTPLWRGARALAAGANPYAAHEGLRGPIAQNVDPRLLYPLPAVVLLRPTAAWPLATLRAVWTALAVAAITWVALRRFGAHGLAVLGSSCSANAILLSQWSPLFLAGAVWPPLQALAVAKPTLGLIVWAYRPTRWVLAGLPLVALAFALRPTWLGEWLAAAGGVSYYVPAAAVWQGGGPLLLLAALRWRRPEARLLLALACVPHNLVWYDQLLLFLVPRRAREAWALAALSWVSLVVGRELLVRGGIPEPAGQVAFRAPIVALLYLPALAMVLARPNAGPPLPGWLTRWRPGRAGPAA